MRFRSWMAALALVVEPSIAVLPAELAQDRKPTENAAPAAKAQADSQPRTIELRLVIAGLGRAGCDVEVKPGNASCKFRAFNDKGAEDRQHVTSTGQATLKLKDIELRGADRTCSVAITVHEPGQDARTFYRGFRLSARIDGAGTASTKPTVPSFTCYLSSPSKTARSEESRMRK